MLFWKADPLYRRVFDQIRALWSSQRPEERPVLLRIEERARPEPGALPFTGRIRNVWLLDDFGLRLAAALKAEPHEYGAWRGRCFEFGLVRFQVDRARSRADLAWTFNKRDIDVIALEAPPDLASPDPEPPGAAFSDATPASA